MIKVTLLLGGIFVLSAALVLKPSKEYKVIDGCKYESQMWGSEDGTKFYICIGENKSIEQSCPPNSFFVRNATITGCIPVDEVSDDCIYHMKPQPCEGIYMYQPQPHQNPKQFYLCPEPNVDPVVLSCSEGAFAKEKGYLGCFNWTQWRDIRDCKSDQ